MRSSARSRQVFMCCWMIDLEHQSVNIFQRERQMIVSLHTLFKVALPKLGEVFLNKALKVVEHSGVHHLAQDLSRRMPFLNDCIDERLLDYKRKVSRQLAGSRTAIINQEIIIIVT